MQIEPLQAPAMRKALKSDADPAILSGALQLEARDLSVRQIVMSGIAGTLAGDQGMRLESAVRTLFAGGFDEESRLADVNGATLGSGLPSGSTPLVDSIVRRASAIVYAGSWSEAPKRKALADKRQRASAPTEKREAKDGDQRLSRVTSAQVRTILIEAHGADLPVSLDGQNLTVGRATVQVPSALVPEIRALLGGAAQSDSGDGAATVQIAHDLEPGDVVYHDRYGDGLLESIDGQIAKVLFETSNRVIAVFLRDIA